MVEISVKIQNWRWSSQVGIWVTSNSLSFHDQMYPKNPKDKSLYLVSRLFAAAGLKLAQPTMRTVLPLSNVWLKPSLLQKTCPVMTSFRRQMWTIAQLWFALQISNVGSELGFSFFRLQSKLTAFTQFFSVEKLSQINRCSTTFGPQKLKLADGIFCN